MNTYTHDAINDPIVRAQVMRSQAVAKAIVEFFATVGEIVRPVIARISKHMAYRRVYNTLSDMTNSELDDIGLCRGDIDAVARGRDPRPQREDYLVGVLGQRAKLEETFTGEGKSAKGEGKSAAGDDSGANDNRSAVAA